MHQKSNRYNAIHSRYEETGTSSATGRKHTKQIGSTYTLRAGITFKYSSKRLMEDTKTTTRKYQEEIGCKRWDGRGGLCCQFHLQVEDTQNK